MTAYRLIVSTYPEMGEEPHIEYLAFSSKKEAFASFREFKKQNSITYKQFCLQEEESNRVTLKLVKYILIEPKKKLILQLLEQRFFSKKIEVLAKWGNHEEYFERWDAEVLLGGE